MYSEDSSCLGNDQMNTVSSYNGNGQKKWLNDVNTYEMLAFPNVSHTSLLWRMLMNISTPDLTTENLVRVI